MDKNMAMWTVEPYPPLNTTPWRTSWVLHLLFLGFTPISLLSVLSRKEKCGANGGRLPHEVISWYAFKSKL